MLDLLPDCELAELGQVVEQLRREVLELRQQVGYWQAMHARASQRIAVLEAENEQLRAENRKLESQLFGRQSEKPTSRDRSNHLDGEPDEAAPLRRGQRRGRPGPPRRNYEPMPVVEQFRELPPDQRVCPQCGAALLPNDTEDSEQIEIEVRAYRRRWRRRRDRRTCTCSGAARTITAPSPPQLIPKGLLGVSVWVEILLGKFFSHPPTERLLLQWRLLGLDLSAGTVAGGWERIEALFTPLYQALLARNAQSPLAQADETRWLVFIEQEGEIGHRWWLWVFVGADTVAFRLDPQRSHEVPEQHFAGGALAVLMVDRYWASKAMGPVKQGNVVLAFCWAHVRRDFVEVGKGWEEWKPWAVAWLRRIRDLDRYQRQRLAHEVSSVDFQTADAAVREVVAAMHAQSETELADPQLRSPCRQVLQSLQEHWSGLTRFVDDRRIPLDNNASERQNRGPALGRKNDYGSGALWSGPQLGRRARQAARRARRCCSRCSRPCRWAG